jgi:hypothetical protein
MSSRYQDRDSDRGESRYSRDEPDRRERPRERERERDRGEGTDPRRRRYEDEASETYRSPRRDRPEGKEPERARSRSPKRERDAPVASRYDGKPMSPYYETDHGD